MTYIRCHALQEKSYWTCDEYHVWRADIISIQKDMKDMKIWNGLWPIVKKKKWELVVLTTPYVLDLEEKKKIVHIIEGFKVHQLDIQVPSKNQFIWTQAS
jgi:hypothetical protein